MVSSSKHRRPRDPRREPGDDSAIGQSACSTDRHAPVDKHASVSLFPLANADFDRNALAAALNHNDEWMDRACVALRAVHREGTQPDFARVIVSHREQAALSFHLSADIRLCAQLTRAVHHALAARFARVVPPSLLIDVCPLVAPDNGHVLSPDIVAELASSVGPLASSAAEANWRQAAVSAYIVTFRLARQLMADTSPAAPNVLDDKLDAAVWQLRMQGTPEARSLAEALASMRRTCDVAAFDFDAPFPQHLALLQREAMQAFQRDLTALDVQLAMARPGPFGATHFQPAR